MKPSQRAGLCIIGSLIWVFLLLTLCHTKAPFVAAYRSPTNCNAPLTVTLTGPAFAFTYTLTALTAAVAPAETTIPITFTWQTPESVPEIRVRSALTDTFMFTWAVTGVQTVTVTAANACGSAIETHTLEVLPRVGVIYLPLVLRSDPPSQPPDPCRPIEGASYVAFSVDFSNPHVPHGPNPNAETDGGYNIGVLGWTLTDAYKGLVDYAGMIDPAPPPQFPNLFADQRVPEFSNVYQLHHGDGSLITDWPVTVGGMVVAADEIIHAPESGYNIGSDYDALVLYASRERITLNYGRGDNLIGYTVYIDGICVEPTLLALYEQAEAAGRLALPAIQGGQSLGRARDAEIRVAIRDNGSPMDPRSRKDWWQGR